MVFFFPPSQAVGGLLVVLKLHGGRSGLEGSLCVLGSSNYLQRWERVLGLLVPCLESCHPGSPLSPPGVGAAGQDGGCSVRPG